MFHLFLAEYSSCRHDSHSLPLILVCHVQTSSQQLWQSKSLTDVIRMCSFPGVFLEKIGVPNVMFLYSAMSFVLLVFVILCIPETKGRTLEEISKELAKK